MNVLAVSTHLLKDTRHTRSLLSKIILLFNSFTLFISVFILDFNVWVVCAGVRVETLHLALNISYLHAKVRQNQRHHIMLRFRKDFGIRLLEDFVCIFIDHFEFALLLEWKLFRLLNDSLARNARPRNQLWFAISGA